MIVPDQKNLKVHFAAMEPMIRLKLMELAGINYTLFTIYPWMADRMKIPNGYQQRVGYNEHALTASNTFRHVIQDSGLFTLLYGKYSGAKDERLIDFWYHNLIEMTLESKFRGTCVELDCQDLIGTEKAWHYREKMANDLPSNRVINVFHFIDGMKGLDRLIEFSNYIAIGMPEFRLKGKVHEVPRIVSYIKNKKPMIDIHLLGCTSKKMLSELNFCSSSDSTSWVTMNKFGSIRSTKDTGGKLYAKKNINRDAVAEKYQSDIIRIMKECNIKVTENSILYWMCDLLSLIHHVGQYSSHSGSQN